MKLSARNVFAGNVQKIQTGAVNSEIDLALEGGGDNIVAVITNHSVEALALKEGTRAFAIVKANWVIIGKELHAARMSTRNVLCGTVEQVEEGAVNSEIVLRLASGATLAAVITNESTHSLQLRKGDHACAAFKASSVIIGVE